ncbi:MAG: hypothetical protein RL477_1627, partial [Pseudomonadota bacterium]
MSARKGLIRALLAALLLFAPASLSAEPADLIVANAKIRVEDGRFQSALAVRDGRFVAFGDAAAIAALRGPKTRLIDAGGRTVIPGLIDSHIHAIRAGLTFDSEASF